jgi:ribosomal protein S18 acetylase RimI-like enzyme
MRVAWRGIRGRSPLVILGLAVIFTLLVAPNVRAQAPQANTTDIAPGQWFAFTYDIYLDNGVGNYSGYTEQTLEQYRYTVLSVVGTNVTMNGSGTWQYSNNNGGSSSGTWAETFSFDSATRLYTWGFDVLGNYTKPYVWFWVPTPLSAGETVRILSSNYTVQSLSSDAWLGAIPVPRVGALLQTSGSYIRDDDYGGFEATWTDMYWFDPRSGYVIGEVYTEQDSNGLGDGFRWREIATVTSSSYPIAYDWVALLAVYAGLPAAVAGSLVYVRWYHRGPRSVRLPVAGAASKVTARRVRNPAKYLALPPGSSSPYGALLPMIVRRARQRKNPVWVATDGQRLVGAMVRDREAKVSLLFTEDAALAKLFRSMNRSRNFFAEVGPSAWSSKAQVVDTFQVLQLSPITAPGGVDPSIRPVRPEDMAEIVRLAERIYGIPEPKWLKQAYQDGDIGFVVWDRSFLAGFAFASVVGDDAILHTLTVHGAYRALGIGRALTAARLNALAALGVQRVIVEISVRNPGSLAIARGFGFRKVGETTYYSRKPLRAVPIDRRPY